jgi:maltose alpha-D-glucosyltransferase/alpha-amylase
LFWLTVRRSSVKGRTGRLTSTPARQLKRMYERSELPFETQVVKAEQSNTSVIYGSRFILKLFRRLQDGINPDLEIGRFLTKKGFSNLPPVAGSLEFRRERAEPDTVAILQGFVPNQSDAWEYTLESLYLYFEYVLTHSRDKMAPLPRENYLELCRQDVPEETRRMIGYYLESVRQLARRTAQMHAYLASDSDDPAFAPESFSKLYQRALYQSMRSLFVRVMAQFRKQFKKLPPDAQEPGGRILDGQHDLLASLQSLIDRKIEGKRLRCHGDYHLGQVLYTGKDFVIIDFEGEPARPISERRIKHSPLRDVAGMLRSFHYAAYNALMTEQSRGLFQPEELALMESWADYWHLWVTAVFMRQYYNDVPKGGFLPKNIDQWGILLDALLLEKAIYELGYELNNRPAWIKIPLKGIEQLMLRAN